MNSRVLFSSGLAVVFGVLVGVTGATAAASTRIAQPRTLFAGSRTIYGFALGAHRITWISRTHMRGSYPGCEMYVRTLRTGPTSRAPLPSAGCGVKPPQDFAPQAPVLASGSAAWVTRSSCGNIECFWAIATITGGESKPRVVQRSDIACDYTCDSSYSPRPSLAAAGNLLVYSAQAGAPNLEYVRRIVGGHTAPFALLPGLGDIQRLIAGGGAVEADSRVLVQGDGCGCVDSPVWSPDGSQIAYLHGTFWNQQVDPYPPVAALAVMNADGSGRHDLTAPTTPDDESFSWSPDGKQIAYVSGSGVTISVVNADGSGSVELGPGSDPTWSPDGSKIAFVDPGCAGISVMNTNGTDPHQLASLEPCLDERGMAWSPDGTRIAFSLGGVLELMNADGTNVHVVGDGTVGSEPSWSPDSSQIVFRDATGLSEIGADGSNLHQLTDDPTDEHPSWSPDGQTVVFGSDRDDPYANAQELYEHVFPELYLVAPDGSDLRPLSFTTPTAFEHPTTFFSATGKLLPQLPGLPALAGKVAAVGSTPTGGVHEIRLFDAKTGAQLSVTTVGARRASFAVAGADAHWVVYRVGSVISALNTSSLKVVLLTRVAARPLDLSVSGRRVAWAENSDGHGRILGLSLPS